MYAEDERQYLETARVGRLATTDADGRPHAVPICFALVNDSIVTPLDEKPKAVARDSLRRVRNIDANPFVSLVVDHWTEDWARLGWVQVRGSARLVDPGVDEHGPGVSALRAKYAQYKDHALDEYPLIWIEPSSVVSWGDLQR